MKNNKNFVRRWVYTINVIRSMCYELHDSMAIDVNDRKLFCIFDEVHPNILHLVDENRDVVMSFDDDGSPDWLSDWAKEPMTFDVCDYPMYE